MAASRPSTIPGPAGKYFQPSNKSADVETCYLDWPWITALEVVPKEARQKLESNNIYEITEKASKGTLPNSKVDWVRVIIDDVVEWDQKANGLITVKDPTGKIKCCVCSNIMMKDKDKWQCGSVLILKEVSVLCFKHGYYSESSTCYFNIIKRNVYCTL